MRLLLKVASVKPVAVAVAVVMAQAAAVITAVVVAVVMTDRKSVV